MGQMIEMKKRQKTRNEASSDNVEKSDQNKRHANKQAENEKEIKDCWENEKVRAQDGSDPTVNRFKYGKVE